MKEVTDNWWLVTDKKDFVKHNGIDNKIFSSFKSLFESTNHIDKVDHNTFLLSFLHFTFCSKWSESCLQERTYLWRLSNALKGTPNNKSPGNDGLTKAFYKTFWDELKDSFINSIELACQKMTLVILNVNQLSNQSKKKDRDKTLLKNWRPISWLNIDLKITSKAFAFRLKAVLPSITSS